MKILLILSLWMNFLTSCQVGKDVSIQNSHAETTGSEYIGGHFEMTDETGMHVTEKTYVGKYTLVFFGFSNCPSVCPMGLSAIGRVMGELSEETEKQIQPLFVTVDPERDTEKRLVEFTKIFHPRLIGLRGTKKQTEDMVFKYRGYYRKVDNEKEYLIDHSDIIYLMDTNGNYLAHFNGSMKTQSMAMKIKNLIINNRGE